MKKENKRKVVTLSAMAALLAVVLGMGGKTYAKYFSEEKETAKSATVAQWGLVLNQTTSDSELFKSNYSDKVVAVDASNVLVAPGTSGTITYTVAGIAEVDATIKFEFESYTPVSVKSTTDSVNYLPIKWTVDGTEIDPANWAGKTVNYDAAEDPDQTIVIAWSWDFSNEENNGVENGDLYDTFLGKKVADSTFTYKDYVINTELSFNLKATFTQR